jgi:DNA polymerase
MGTSALVTLLDDIEHSLRHMAEAGCTGFDVSSDALALLEGWGSVPAREYRESLSGISAELGDCRRCRLHRDRRHLVFGEGDPHPRLVFVGEGPGFEEDRQGRPFVGPAGALLTRIIEAMGLRRDEVYICNVVKCRPPENRTPQADEIEVCGPFLRRQLLALAPVCICALGAVAAQFLTGTRRGISELRGRFYDFHGIPVMPTFHPAYLLRNPERKREVWADIQQVMGRLGLKGKGEGR